MQDTMINSSIPVEGGITESEIISTDLTPEPEFPDMHTTPLVPSKRYFRLNWWSVIAITLLIILVGEHVPSLINSIDNTLFHPSALVTLFPKSPALMSDYSFTARPNSLPGQVKSRFISITTSTKTTSISTTGIAYTPPTQAQGSITFYNIAPYVQTINSGTVLTGNDGIAVVTDEAAYIKAGDPIESQTVQAHAIEGGSKGNIPAFDINTLCCLSGISAKNTASFTGGVNPVSYRTISRNDISKAISSYLDGLDREAKAALQSQIEKSERTLTPTECSVNVSSQPNAGEAAEKAKVSVSESCRSVLYDFLNLQTITTVKLTDEAAQKWGAGFKLFENPTIRIKKISKIKGPAYELQVEAWGKWLFQLSHSQLNLLSRMIAGKRLSDAQTSILKMYQVNGVYIKPVNPADLTLPANPEQIKIIVAMTG